MVGQGKDTGARGFIHQIARALSLASATRKSRKVPPDALDRKLNDTGLSASVPGIWGKEIEG